MAVNPVNTMNTQSVQMYKSVQKGTQAEEMAGTSLDSTDRVELSKKGQELNQKIVNERDTNLTRLANAAEELMSSAKNNENNVSDILKLTTQNVINDSKTVIEETIQAKNQNMTDPTGIAAASGKKIDDLA